MGTSTGYLKAKRSYFFPVRREQLSERLSVQVGGTCNCGIFKYKSKLAVINCSRDDAAAALFNEIEQSAPGVSEKYLISNSSLDDDIGGADYFRHYQRVKKDLAIGDEEIRVHPLSDTDLIYMTRRKVLFAGRLFYNGVHPPLRERGMALRAWISSLEEVLSAFDAVIVVPAEGDVTDLSGLRAFRDYLRDFSDPVVGLQTLRDRYGHYSEIIGTSSLAENYEFARGIKVK